MYLPLNIDNQIVSLQRVTRMYGFEKETCGGLSQNGENSMTEGVLRRDDALLNYDWQSINVFIGLIGMLKNMNLGERITEIIEPRNENALSIAYDWLMLVAIIIGIVPLIFREQYRVFWYFDIISGCCFLMDYVLRWLTVGFRAGRSRVVAFVQYPFTPMAIIDLLSILPTVNLLSPTFKVVRVSRLLKVLRVIKFVRYFEPLEIILAVIRRQKKVLCTVFSLALFYIFITALIMFNAEEDINPETGCYLFDNFFDAFYWAACTLTTVGYGDLYPISDVGRVISIISSMVGIAIIALPSGIITAGYMDEVRERKEIRNSGGKSGSVEN